MKYLRWLLLPLSIAYLFVVAIRNVFFNFHVLKSKSYHIPIISVGNMSVGGTGKTPHIEYLIKLLYKDFKIAVVSRGYKRKSSGYVKVGSHHFAFEVGDEPKQLKNKFPEIDVVISERRSVGIERLLSSENKPDVILLDDAFQHRYVKPGLSILLTTYNKPYTNDWLLPAGFLREPKIEARRADVIIVSKSPDGLDTLMKEELIKKIKPKTNQKLYFSKIKYKNLNSPFYKKKISKKAESVILVIGIADTELIEKYVNGFCDQLILFKFADHYQYSESDIRKILKKYNSIKKSDKIIITTEKDFVRMQKPDLIDQLKNVEIYTLPIEVEIEEGEKFNKQIIDYVRKNK